MAVPPPPSDAARDGALPSGSETPGSAEAALVAELVLVSRRFDATGADAERNCWMAVHEHIHGVLPSEYDIREIDEDLYLAVLARRLGENACPDDDLSGTAAGP